MKIVIDMNLSGAWVQALAGHGVEALHWSEVGAGSASDAEILSWAQSNGAVVLTRDLDFGTMVIRQDLMTPSVIQLRIDQINLDHHARLVASAISAHATLLTEGMVMTIQNDRVRVRALAASPAGTLKH